MNTTSDIKVEDIEHQHQYQEQNNIKVNKYTLYINDTKIDTKSINKENTKLIK